MNEKINYIYGLVDSVTNELKYIGKTINSKKRLNEHIRESKFKRTYKDCWISSLTKINRKPEILIIDTITGDGWEKHFIL